MTAQDKDEWKNAALKVLGTCLFAIVCWVGISYAGKIAVLETAQSEVKTDVAVIKINVEGIKAAVQRIEERMPNK